MVTDTAEVMDADTDAVDTASTDSSPETKPEGIKELEGTDELETMELANILDTAVIQQLTNLSDDMDVRYGARSWRYNL